MIRRVQLLLALFVAVSAIGGFVMMLCDPDGIVTATRPLIDKMAEAFPFASCMFMSLLPSAIALLLANGVSNLISAFLLYSNHKYGSLSSLFSGMILIIWTSAEIYAWGINGLSVAFGIIGLIQVALHLFKTFRG